MSGVDERDSDIVCSARAGGPDEVASAADQTQEGVHEDAQDVHRRSAA